MKGKITKNSLVDAVFEDIDIKDFGISRKEVYTIAGSFIENLRKSIINLKVDDRIELRGFGTFGVKKRKARIARNPKTGAAVNVPSRNIAYFKAGIELKLNVKKG